EGGGEARRASTESREIGKSGYVKGFVETQTMGHLAIRGITQNRFPATDHHRRLSDRDMEVIEEALNVGVAFQIDVSIRVPVAREEFLNAKGIGGMAGGNDCCIANTLH